MKEAKSSQAGFDPSALPEEARNERRRIYWISPNLNHYKKKFLSRLANTVDMDLTVLAGKTPFREGHKTDDRVFPLHIIQMPVVKRWFGIYPPVYWETLKAAAGGEVDAFMMPSEKRFFPLILWLFIIKIFFGFKLVTYTHPFMRSRPDRVTKRDLFWTKRIFLLFDRVVFYTEASRDWALRKRLVHAGKADYANNTLDTEDIRRHYEFMINLETPRRILFIGRLIANKRLDLLLRYFRLLRKGIPDLELTVIGDGPEAVIIKNAQEAEAGITWLGAIVDEGKIATEMRRAHLVFCPENSGLSVVHALSYGKPYVTFAGMTHGPEVSYIKNGFNGYLLKGSEQENILKIKKLLQDEDLYGKICENANATAQKLSIYNWCKRISNAFRSVK